MIMAAFEEFFNFCLDRFEGGEPFGEAVGQVIEEGSDGD